jgi:ketosteroid isomerase-like protein
MMAEHDNVQVVQQGYAAFGQGDIPGVLALCTDDIEWVQEGPAELPWSGTFHGQEEVGGFFRTLGENVTFTQFEPYEFIAQGDRVVGLVHTAGTVTPSGGQFTTEDAHLFTIRGGKLARFQLYTDTQALTAAYRGE